ncbi:hypothetical protein JCM3766R1_000893 [Sporobolomyces carnicolor]
MPTYVIEHMEDDNRDSTFPHWIALEYAQMCRLATDASHVIFSSLSPASVASLTDQLVAKGIPRSAFTVETRSVRELMREQRVELERVCLLDPRATKVIGPDDKSDFDWFLFGGILGDDPPRDRTGILRRDGYPSRHLGPVQMTTDTALGVTKLCVQDGKRLDEIHFVDHPTIKFPGKGYENESVEMPFRYVVDERTGEPILPDGMREHLRDDMDRELEDF